MEWTSRNRTRIGGSLATEYNESVPSPFKRGVTKFVRGAGNHGSTATFICGCLVLVGILLLLAPSALSSVSCDSRSRTGVVCGIDGVTEYASAYDACIMGAEVGHYGPCQEEEEVPTPGGYVSHTHPDTQTHDSEEREGEGLYDEAEEQVAMQEREREREREEQEAYFAERRALYDRLREEEERERETERQREEERQREAERQREIDAVSPPAHLEVSVEREAPALTDTDTDTPWSGLHSSLPGTVTDSVPHDTTLDTPVHTETETETGPDSECQGMASLITDMEAAFAPLIQCMGAGHPLSTDVDRLHRAAMRVVDVCDLWMEGQQQ
ncbi:hypothetical protein KIPB_009493 [Kipferlia bialata]|uniref:Uncharacterized protein n=1 Tax=Kipferlia bialata TaxID=797122 RepID=A0A9K3D2F8_9EUKA|nr:hypothetical protein KIPB_009493 [Kipferlia bialata]|eukprot:g9493.t1